MKWKIIPATTEEKYISGWEALNVVAPDGITTADWHPLNYWLYTEKNPTIPLYANSYLFGKSGISKRIIPYDRSKEVFIADFPRAIADFILTQPKELAMQMLDCRKDFLSTKEEDEKLYSYLEQIQNVKDISWFIRREYPEKHLNDRKAPRNVPHLTHWRQERIHVMKKMLSYLGDEYVVKGGSALMLFHQLDRFSETLELDTKSSFAKVEKVLPKIVKENRWKYHVLESTDSVVRIIIDYGGQKGAGDYPLILEVSDRNKKLLDANVFKVKRIENVSVYDWKVLIDMKLAAFAKQENIRDFYDLAFFINRRPDLFSNEQLFQIKTVMEYKGLRILAGYLETELATPWLAKIGANDLVANTFAKTEDLLITRNQ